MKVACPKYLSHFAGRRVIHVADPRGVVLLTSLLIFSMASCANQPPAVESLTTQPELMSPTVFTEPPTQERQTVSGASKDADCVLTTGDVHLWCNWISKYY